jgi:hypothetical protein
MPACLVCQAGALIFGAAITVIIETYGGVVGGVLGGVPSSIVPVAIGVVLQSARDGTRAADTLFIVPLGIVRKASLRFSSPSMRLLVCIP